jgi:predicted metal-dependent phosphoesterase TrpH
MHRQQHQAKVTEGLRADLHAHTNASFDCRTTVAQLLRAAQKAGLHAVAITDHDSIDAHDEALRLAPRYGLQVIPGVELTATDGTHIVAYFMRKLPTDKSLAGILRFIQEEGGVSCVAHPHRSDTGLIYNEEAGRVSKKDVEATLTTADLIEAVNFKSLMRQEGDDLALAKKYNKPVVASTDAHYDFEVGKAFTRFDVPFNMPLTPDILKHAKRDLWSHPVRKVPSKKATLPLAHIEPSESKVAMLKRFLGPIVPLLGKILYAWQRYTRLKAKRGQIASLLQDSPEPLIYQN